MQGFDHRLVAIHQADIQAEARRQRVIAADPFEVPVQRVEPVAAMAHGGWREILGHLASPRTVAHGHRS